MILAVLCMTAAIGVLLIMFLAITSLANHDDVVLGLQLDEWLIGLTILCAISGFFLAAVRFVEACA